MKACTSRLFCVAVILFFFLSLPLLRNIGLGAIFYHEKANDAAVRKMGFKTGNFIGRVA